MRPPCCGTSRRRLFGGRAAFFAAALFAVLGPTQFLGALATYDAMALLLIAISAWCVVAARDRGDSTLLLVAGAAALALANATKYATALFDPVVVVLAALVISGQGRGKPGLGRAGYLAAFVTAPGRGAPGPRRSLLHGGCHVHDARAGGR